MQGLQCGRWVIQVMSWDGKGYRVKRVEGAWCWAESVDAMLGVLKIKDAGSRL